LAKHRAVLQRASELVELLQAEVAPLQALRNKYLAASERLSRLAPGDEEGRALVTAELARLDQASRQTGEAVNQALRRSQRMVRKVQVPRLLLGLVLGVLAQVFELRGRGG
jgi:hypothetical protein